MSSQTSSKPQERDTQSPSASTANPYWSGQESIWTRLSDRFLGVYEDLDSGRDGAKSILQSSEHKPSIFSLATYKSFFTAFPSSIQVARRSPEVVFFAALQWVAVVLGYLAWTHVLQLIPDEVWNAVDDAIKRDDHSPAFALCNLALLAWTFVVVCIVSYPIGLCSAAMVAVNDLRAANEEVTFAKCFAVADQHLGRIWAFTIVDSWITVLAILDRLPRKGGHRSAADELLYYAWKVGTVGVVPALVNGRSFADASRDSLTLLRDQTARTLGLRLGYSAVCWIVGVSTYIASFFFVHSVEGGIPHGAHHIFHFYMLMAVPVAIATAVVTIFLRPFFLLGVSQLYAELIDVKEEVEKDVEKIPQIEMHFLSGRFLLFLAILIPLLGAIFFSDQLGLSQWIARLGHMDVQRYEHR
jgi:hypothetical protein